jgi:ferredoxin--NADP+ reductase
MEIANMTRLSDYDTSRRSAAVVKESHRITSKDVPEVRSILLSVAHPEFTYREGQNIGITVPGAQAFGQEQHFRLYTIANSPRQAENGKVEIELCVRRCFYIDEVSGERYPGVASNFLCDAKPGDPVKLTGPYGRHFLPPRDNSCNMLMIGVGTGIAPFRAFIKHIYDERKEWKGKVRLFYGARTGMDLLYMNDKNDDLSLYYDQESFKAFEAISPRPHFDEPEEVEGAIKEHEKEVWDLIQDPKTFVYVSGLTKLEDRLDKILGDLAGSEDKWQAQKKEMILSGRWSTLFYD